MKTVLIADDDEAARRLLALSLSSEQYQLLEARDGDEAWQLITTRRPHVVVLDVLMPKRNGFDLAYAIKNDPALGGVYIIMVSALARDDHRAAATLAGADIFITKPYSPAVVRRAVERALNLGDDGEDDAGAAP